MERFTEAAWLTRERERYEEDPQECLVLLLDRLTSAVEDYLCDPDTQVSQGTLKTSTKVTRLFLREVLDIEDDNPQLALLLTSDGRPPATSN